MSPPSSKAVPAFLQLDLHLFRRLQNISLTGLNRLNILVGDNNAGKTSILEAVFLLSKGVSYTSLTELHENRFSSDSAREELAEATYSLGSINPATRVSKVNLSASLYNGGHQAVEFSCQRRGTSTLELTAAVRSTKVPGFTEPGTGPFGDLLSKTVPFTGHGSPIDVAWVGIATHRDETLQAALLNTATRNRSKRELVSLLQTLDNEIEGLAQIQGMDGKLISVIELRHVGLALPHFGDAVRRFLFLAMTITSIPNGVLLVDEAEASIHWSRFPQMAKALLELLHEFNVQAFFTTHSLELIDAFVDATPEKDDVALYRLTRAQDDGRTVVTALKEEHVRTLRHMLAHEVR